MSGVGSKTSSGTPWSFSGAGAFARKSATAAAMTTTSASAAADTTADSISAAVSTATTRAPAGSGSGDAVTSVTRAPRCSAAAAIAWPCFPEDRFVMTRTGSIGSLVPPALTDYIKNREGYDYRHHGKAGNPMTEFVPDDVIDRFCILGPAEAHRERLGELAALGVDQFAIYLMHDRQEETLKAYATDVIPQLVEVQPGGTLVKGPGQGL